MKLSIYIALLISLGWLTKTFEVNQLIDDAEKAFHEKDYSAFISITDTLLDSTETHHEILQLNQGHAYYLQNDTANIKKAKSTYQLLTGSDEKARSTIAHNQLGNANFSLLIKEHPEILENQPLSPEAKTSIEKIMEEYKNALRADQFNEKARYNYELMYWLLHKDDKDNQQQDQNQDQQQNKDQENQQNQENQQDQQQNQQNQENKQDQQNNQDQQKKGQDKQDQQGQNKDQKGDQKEESKKDQQGQEGKKDEKGKQEEQKSSKQSQEEKKGEEQEQQQAQQGKEGEQKEGQEGQPKKGIRLSKEQAMKLLQSGQGKEKKYLEREMKKSSKPIDTDKPDW